MSLWNDFWDFVSDTAEGIGNTLSDAWHAIKNNPIGTITSAVAMAYGIPPAWAGALGGAAGAAATGGNVVKAAITGGAMGYMGAAAGAAAGEAGAIAQAAAGGAAAAATGAVLTGQDVLTAVKQGLILGTTVGLAQKGYQLMTQQEAIASIPKDKLAQIYATGADPLGDLIDQMGWVDSNSAKAAAAEAFSKNVATTMQQLQDSVPDYVLKEAYDYTKVHGGDQNAYVADKLGWNLNGRTAQAIQTAYNDFVSSGAVVKPVEAKPTTADDLVKTGLVDAGDAATLHSAGYTVDDLKTLTSAGYTGSELADMASAGVSKGTLTSLTHSPYSSEQINDMLGKNVSANDIASAGTLIKNGTVSMDNATNLLEKGVDGNDLYNFAYKGQVSGVLDAMDKGLSLDTIRNLDSQGWNISNVNNQIASGNVTANDLNNVQSGQNYYKLLNQTVVKPSVPTEPTTYNSMAEAQAAQADAGGTGSISKVNGKYVYTPAKQAVAPTEVTQPTQPTTVAQPTQPTTPTTVTQPSVPTVATPPSDLAMSLSGAGVSASDVQKFLDQGYTPQQISNSYQTSNPNGWQAALQNETPGVQTVQPTQPTTAQTPPTTTNITPVTPTQPTVANNIPAGSIEVTMPNGETGYYNTDTGDLYWASGEKYQFGVTPGQGTQVAENTVSQPGGTVTDTGTSTGFRVEVGGTPKYAGQTGAGQAPAGYEQATPTDVFGPGDTNSAQNPYTSGTYLDPNTNTWFKPITQTTTPIVPIIIPPTTTVPSTTVGGTVPTTPNTPSTTTTTPTTTTTTTPTTQTEYPPVPTKPTVVSSSTRTTYDGSVYRDDQMSNGTVTSILISGPTGAGGTGTGTGTSNTTSQTPLSPVTKVEIPPGSSYVAPVETTTPLPTETTTTGTGTTPTDTTTPIIPIIIPPDKTPTTEDTTRGHYTLGEPVHPAIPGTLNPGWITNVPAHYAATNPAQSRFYWGAHPYQTGTTFDPTLYNNLPYAPAQAWGANFAQTSATPQQIISQMNFSYPYPVSGAIKP